VIFVRRFNVNDVLSIINQIYESLVLLCKVLQNSFQFLRIILHKLAIQKGGAFVENIIVRLRIENAVFLKNVFLLNFIFDHKTHETKW